jgi:DNA modification methylase
MADHHDAKDGSHRRTYKHYLGRDLSPGNSGAMQWGDDYRELHLKAWQEVFRVLKQDGFFLLNCKDHHRAGKRVHVSTWHYQTIKSLGFKLVDLTRVSTPGYRYGENREIRYPERVLVFKKGS